MRVKTYFAWYDMPQLLLDVSEEVLRRLKTGTARENRSLQDYITERAPAGAPDVGALADLAQFLAPRISEADSGTRSGHSIREIAQNARKAQTG